MALKTCEKCGCQKTTTDYYKDNRYVDGFSKICKTCHKRKVEVNYSKSIKKRARRNDLKRKYNISLNDYHNLFIKQCGYCYICLTHQKTLKRKLAVDHCHETGKVRGLLCRNCNTALGQMKDSTFLLQRMIEYLNKFNGENK